MRAWGRRIRRLLTALAALVLLAGAYFGLMSGKVLSVWRTSHGVPSDCAIVLGAAAWNGKPSPALRERLDIAVEVYRRKLASHLILSGGRAAGEKLSEAQVMKNYLVSQGVPAAALLVEDRSYSTMENLENSKAIMDREGYRSAVLVTHGFHALRASLMARSLGIRTSVEPVQIRPINLKYYVLRECAGIAFFEVDALRRKWLGT
ncbi:YdcF family protein [Paenibacillus aurantius]|uniref:YdcF family protein n=1 Tax=Paenibacillus aurantius TaxID=2918900 RepID=A0AA96LDE1_9BACL|nr:YdcF family protein [Paenibacillus aurantius]WNQ11934.1 YdcF family protein [Paenibacillus aurantius]